MRLNLTLGLVDHLLLRFLGSVFAQDIPEHFQNKPLLTHVFIRIYVYIFTTLVFNVYMVCGLTHAWAAEHVDRLAILFGYT